MLQEMGIWLIWLEHRCGMEMVKAKDRHRLEL